MLRLGHQARPRGSTPWNPAKGGALRLALAQVYEKGTALDVSNARSGPLFINLINADPTARPLAGSVGPEGSQLAHRRADGATGGAPALA